MPAKKAPAKRAQPRGAAHVDRAIKGKGGKGVDTWQERHPGVTWGAAQKTNRNRATTAGWQPDKAGLAQWIKRNPNKAYKAKLETPGPKKGPLPMPKVPKKAPAKRAR